MPIDRSRDIWLVKPDERQLSHTAQQIRNWGELICRCSWITSALIVIGAATGSGYIDESRLLTFVFMGIVPATLIYMTGFLLRLALMWVSAIYDVFSPYIKRAWNLIAGIIGAGLKALDDGFAKLNLYSNLVRKPTRIIVKCAKRAYGFIRIDAAKAARLKKLHRQAYRGVLYVSMFPVRRTAQFLLRILDRDNIAPGQGQPAYYPRV